MTVLKDWTRAHTATAHYSSTVLNKKKDKGEGEANSVRDC